MNDRGRNDLAPAPIWGSLLQAAQRVEARVESALADSGLSLAKLGVLRHLVEVGEPIPLSKLAGRLACVKSNVTQLVDRLVTDGYVRRVADPADRRSVLAQITDEGRRRYEAGSRIVAEVETDLFGDLSDEDRSRMLGLLDGVGAR